MRPMTNVIKMPCFLVGIIYFILVMCEDSMLDIVMEDRLNGGPYPDDIGEDRCPDCLCSPCRCVEGAHESECPNCGCLPCEYPAESDESMDGDFDSAMTIAGFGTDEDYGASTHDWEGGCE